MRRLVASAVIVSVTAASPFRDAAANPIDDQRQLVTAITDQLAALEERSDVLAEDHVVALDELRRAEAEVLDAQARVDAKAAEVAAMRSQVTEVAVRNYMGAGGSGLSALLTDTSRATEVLERQTLSRVALSLGDATIDEFDEAVDDLNDQRTALQSAQQEAEQRTDAVAEAKQANEDSKAQYQQARRDAEAELGDLIREEEERRARESYEQAQRAAEQAAAEQAAAAQAAQARQQAQTAATSTAAPRTAAPAATSPSNPAGRPEPPPAASPTPRPAALSEPAQAEPPAPAPAPPSPPAASSRVDIAISAAKTQLGVPWVFAMAQPGVGFDCSGLTKWAWEQAGVSLPHQSRAQASLLPEVPASQAQPGDLLFYYSPISHVGIYLGGGQLIHSPNSGTTVKIANVNWNNVSRVGRPG